MPQFDNYQRYDSQASAIGMNIPGVQAGPPPGRAGDYYEDPNAEPDDQYQQPPAGYYYQEGPGVGERAAGAARGIFGGVRGLMGWVFDTQPASYAAPHETTLFLRLAYGLGGFSLLIASGLLSQLVISLVWPNWVNFAWLGVIVFTIAELWLQANKQTWAKILCGVILFFDWLINDTGLYLSSIGYNNPVTNPTGKFIQSVTQTVQTKVGKASVRFPYEWPWQRDLWGWMLAVIALGIAVLAEPLLRDAFRGAFRRSK